MSSERQYRFSFGPWNISEGADPFGPDVREPVPLVEKLDLYKPNGFDGVQFHDDDVVPDIDDLTNEQVMRRAKEVRALLDERGLEAEFVAPRMWFAPETIDGGFTANSERDRQYALDRHRCAIDIARTVGTRNIVLWLAREGSYIRESKDAKRSYERILEGINRMLAHDPEIEIWIEPKPNEPMDLAYVPTAGHAVALAYASDAPDRVKILIETAHAMLAGLDPSDEMAFALALGKLASVHLNDQNGLKYDQDKAFGSANLRSAFNQVRVLETNGYGSRGEFIGLDIKAMRTQPGPCVIDHLVNSRGTFLRLLEKARSFDEKAAQALVEARDYEGLDALCLGHLLSG